MSPTTPRTRRGKRTGPLSTDRSGRPGQAGPRRGTSVQDDGGAALIEFVMISILLVFLLFAVLQVAAVFYVRNVVAASATDGARYAAAAGADPGDGGRRATALIADGLNPAMSRQVPCTGSTRHAAVGLDLVGVRCAGRIRSIFLPFGAFTRIDVVAHSVREPA